ncbi:MAG: hypothetical protein PHH37_10995 [Paludibacter sp.]|nr:hypothetical protein [Paludibacter sp.]
MKENKNIKLDEIGSRLPFTVPDNYFEDFSNQFESAISFNKVSWMRVLRPWLYMAAMFAGIIFISRIGYNVYQDKKTAKVENYDMYVISQVNDAEIFDYYASQEKVTNNN